jgi:diguanylate cyclase
VKKSEILTGIGFYQYHICALVLVAAYSVYHFLFGFIIVACALMASTIINMLLIANRIYGKHNVVLIELSAISISSAVLSACYYLGIRGIAWIFPLVVGLFFFYPVRRALVYSFVSGAACLIAATNTLELKFVLRMIFPILLTLAFAYLYRTAIEKDQLALEKEANEDHLTGVYNRRSFKKWLDRAARSMVNNNQFLAVFYIDIDDFKLINDTYGHKVGDLVLTEVSRRLADNIRPTDEMSRVDNHQVARIAGDEFVIATGQLHTMLDAERIAERLLEAINQPASISGLELSLSASIGVAVCTETHGDSESILAEADAAMYQSKNAGKNRITFFDTTIAKSIQLKKKIAAGLESALRNNEFFLNFMPIFGNDGSSLTGVEVLIRTQSEKLNGIGPDQYIPVAEESGLIREIDFFVIEQTFKHIKQIRNQLPRNFKFAINISAKELVNESFPEKVQLLVEKYNMPTDKIEFELTETSLVSLDPSHIAMLNSIKALGFKLSLDDFGTGYTAFSQLQHYPVDTLKIDRSFVWDITKEGSSKKTMVDVILSLAKLYHVNVVAEGVENKYQLDYLMKEKCDHFQGFFLSKPLRWEAFIMEYFS